MRVLDLYCGAGGASRGYVAAGYTVTGVDADPAPLRNYPYPSIRADALDVLAEPTLLTGVDLIHASPPCQTYSITRHTHADTHPDLLAATLEALHRTGLPWVIENVPGAPLDPALTLCGTMFGLQADDPATGRIVALRRHRLFASNLPLAAPAACTCLRTRRLDQGNLRPTRQADRIGGVYGGGSNDNRARKVRRGGYTPAKEVWVGLMGIDWMTRDQLAQAIPPAYTHWIGTLLRPHLEENRHADHQAPDQQPPEEDGLQLRQQEDHPVRRREEGQHQATAGHQETRLDDRGEEGGPEEGRRQEAEGQPLQMHQPVREEVSR